MFSRTVRRALLLSIALLPLSIMSTLLPTASAQTPVGAIAYVRASTGDEIRLIEPSGANDRRLWGHGLPDQEQVHSVWSLEWRPNANEIAFASTHENACSINHSDIFTIRADGSGHRRITEAPSCAALAGYPKGTVQVPVQNSGFSSFVGFVYFQGAPSIQQVSLPPGGSTTVTFNNVADFGNSELQVATFIQGARRYVSIGTAVDVQAGGSVRTGTMSVFNLSEFYVWEAFSPTWRSDSSAIGYILNYNGLRQITPNPPPLDFGTDLQTDQGEMPDFADLLTWGPGARANQLLYAGNIAFDSEGVYLLTAGSGTAGEKLVSFETYQNIRGLAWLPDGSGFVYAVAEEFGNTKANIFAYSFASRQSTRLTNFESDFAGQLSVSPDGSQIVFDRAASADPDAPADVWIMNRNGSGQQLLVRDGRAPAWSPGPLQIPRRVYLPMIRR